MNRKMKERYWCKIEEIPNCSLLIPKEIPNNEIIKQTIESIKKQKLFLEFGIVTVIRVKRVKRDR